MINNYIKLRLPLQWRVNMKIKMLASVAIALSVLLGSNSVLAAPSTNEVKTASANFEFPKQRKKLWFT